LWAFCFILFCGKIYKGKICIVELRRNGRNFFENAEKRIKKIETAVFVKNKNLLKMEKSENFDTTEYSIKVEEIKNFLESNKNSIAMIFHRHAEHVNDGTQEDEIKRLSIETDIERTIKMAELIDFDLTVAFSVKNLRSFLTANCLLKPEDSINLDQEAQILKYKEIQSGSMKNKIRAKKELGYKDPTKFSFFKELTKAFDQNRVLDFLVHHSDEYVTKGEDISAYSVVAKDVAKIVKIYEQKKDPAFLLGIKDDSQNIFSLCVQAEKK